MILFQRICFIGLFVTAILFMKEVLDQFASNDTSLKQKRIPITEYPTITICLKNPSSAGERGNPYSYGTDFYVSFDFYDIDHMVTTRHEQTIIDHENEDEKLKFEFQKMYSLFEENCYKFKEANLGGNLDSNSGCDLRVIFNETFSVEDLPNIEVIVTSEENSNGIVFTDWRDGVALKFEFDGVKIKYSYISNTDKDIGLEFYWHLFSE